DGAARPPRRRPCHTPAPFHTFLSLRCLFFPKLPAVFRSFSVVIMKYLLLAGALLAGAVTTVFAQSSVVLHERPAPDNVPVCPHIHATALALAAQAGAVQRRPYDVLS